MKVLNFVNTAKLVAKQLQKPCMFISHNVDGVKIDWNELILAAPYLTFKEHGHAIFYDSSILVFDTIEEMEEAFWQTVGDDGPTKTNSYNGPARVYALTISDKGETLNENT